MKKNLLVVLIILLILLSGCAGRIRDNQQDHVTNATSSIPKGTSGGTRSFDGPGAVSCNDLKPLIILVEFPDVKHRVERGNFVYRYNTQVNSYIREMSYGKYCLNGEVTGQWYELPHDTSYYRISSRNLEVNRTRVAYLIQDALAAADDDYDYANYDFVVLQLGALTSDYGMVGLCGHPGMLGWTETDVLRAPSGEIVPGGVAIFTAQAHSGTNFHDIAHILGGVRGGNRMVPCLYDHDLQAKPGPELDVFRNAMINMGYWDPMSCHWYKFENPPPGICSWTRIRLGWLSEDKIRNISRGERTEVVLGPLEDPSSEVLAIRIPITPSTYYLIENRAPIGVDKTLPDHGILIMYADDRIPECHKGSAPLKLIDANPAIPYLEGAAFDIGEIDEYVDEKNKFRVKLVEKINDNYRILIEPI